MEVRSPKVKQVLVLCAEGPVRFTKLKQDLNLSDAGLAKNLRRLQSNELIISDERGYSLTEKGRELLKQLNLGEEMRKQKLVKKLLGRQELASYTDPITFESLRVRLSGLEPLSRSRYQAVAFVEAVDVTSDRVLDSDTSIKVYDNALRMAAAALGTEKTAKLTVTVDLDRGFELAEKQLENRIRNETDEAKRKKLEAILRQFKERRDANMDQMRKRFFST